MKIRVTMPGAYTAVELDDSRCLKAFQKLNETLMVIAKEEHQKKQENIDVEAVEKPVKESEKAVEPEDKEPVTEESEVEDAAVDQNLLILTGYKGFLYIKCQKCGEIKGYCTKYPLKYHQCACGAKTELVDLVPLYISCECGRKFKYQTNMTEKQFDIECLDCGAPVAVHWNEKKKLYEAIR